MAPSEPVAPGRTVAYVVPPQLAGERLDRVVTALHPELSRAAISALIADGRVSVNGRPCKAATRPVAGARITLNLPPAEPVAAEAEAIPLDVIFEDDALVVINKAAGMVVHPAPGNPHGTLVNALLARYADLPGESFRPGIVHRLDKDTSGLIVVARTAPALAALAAAFKKRDVYKEYLALVVGHPKPANGSISGDIGRDPRHRQRMAVVAVGGREAHTTYETVELLGGYALLRVVLGTGRTHQIRVHLGALGFPIAGDPTYGRPSPALGLDRQFLHAARLRFTHPFTGEELDLRAAPPSDLQAVLKVLR
ncbi:MAG TPA: RluA family pseudouridine synthase [Chloroflexota bacterium]